MNSHLQLSHAVSGDPLLTTAEAGAPDPVLDTRTRGRLRRRPASRHLARVRKDSLLRRRIGISSRPTNHNPVLRGTRKDRLRSTPALPVRRLRRRIRNQTLRDSTDAGSRLFRRPRGNISNPGRRRHNIRPVGRYQGLTRRGRLRRDRRPAPSSRCHRNSVRISKDVPAAIHLRIRPGRCRSPTRTPGSGRCSPTWASCSPRSWHR